MERDPHAKLASGKLIRVSSLQTMAAIWNKH
jgi:hypothetical protein